MYLRLIFPIVIIIIIFLFPFFNLRRECYLTPSHYLRYPITIKFTVTIIYINMQVSLNISNKCKIKYISRLYI